MENLVASPDLGKRRTSLKARLKPRLSQFRGRSLPDRSQVPNSTACEQSAPEAPPSCQPSPSQSPQTPQASERRADAESISSQLGPSPKPIPVCTGCGTREPGIGNCAQELTARCSACQSRSPFLNLPAELHLGIARLLDCPTVLSLKICNKRLYERIPAPIPREDCEILDFLWRIRPAVPRHLKLCLQCVKYHPDNVGLLNNVSTGARESPGSLEFCLRRYDRTSLWPMGINLGRKYYVCRHCGELRLNRKCQTCGMCEECVKMSRPTAVECVKRKNGEKRPQVRDVLAHWHWVLGYDS